MGLHFHKMHGAGNDFVLLDFREGPNAGADLPDANQVRSWADRHTGVGFDQLLTLECPKGPEAAARVRIWNADGSPAEQCGNGMRAIGLYLAARTRGDTFLLEAPVAEITVRHVGGDQVAVAMGEARFDPETVPLRNLETAEDGWYRLTFDGATVRFGALSMGNPHAVIEVPDLDRAPIETVGKSLRAHPAFPESCNVGFAQVLGEGHIRLRVLERGAGETRACGSGACAAVAWLARQGRVGAEVRVTQAGGTLWVATDRGAGPVTLTGPAAHVFEGTFA